MIEEIILYGAILLVVSTTLGFTLYKYRALRAKPLLPPAMPIEAVEALYVALGKSANIQSVQIEHQRIKIEIKDIKKIDQMTIKQLEIPAFLTGKTLKLLIKSQPEAVIEYIENKRKEE